MSRIDQGRARPPGGPAPGCELPVRVDLNHVIPGWVKNGAVFFITGSCANRGVNQLCRPEVAPLVLAAVQYYANRGDWYPRLFLLMPDHFHALLVASPEKSLTRLVGDWKRFTAMRGGIAWQKNFFDHRLRGDESFDEKAAYIRQNPIRAGLIRAGETWPYVIEN